MPLLVPPIFLQFTGTLLALCLFTFFPDQWYP